MQHVFREQDGVTVVELRGKMMGVPDDTPLLARFSELAEAGKVRLVLDFSAVEHMNSRGLGICVSGVMTLRKREGDLRLACLPDKVKRMLDQCRVFAIFQSYPTVADAVRSFDA